MSDDIIEPNLNQRIEDAQEKAKKIFRGEAETTEDFIYSLRSILSQQYNIPFFDSYFDNLTIDQLVFEAELLRLRKTDDQQYTHETVQENKEEAESIFDDWVEENFQGSDTGQEDKFHDSFMREAQEFMETGEFKTEE